MDYPRDDRPYALITDASLGDDKKPGGLGAILTQINKSGEHCVIAYASRKLQKHEANYTPFLLEMQAAIWGMDHFDTYLRGRHFVLYTDHKPLEKLGKVHTKTLNRLQEAMGRYDFEICYKKGSEMPADYLSRNVVAAVNWDAEHLVQAQEQDNLVRALKAFLLNKELPRDAKCQQLVKHFSDSCFVEDGLVWRRIKRPYEPSRVVIFLPESMISEAIREAHGQLLSGHDGIFKTKERLYQCFYWPGMDTDIANHLQHCHKCQLRRKDDRPGPALVTPLPQTSEPGQRVHADLFGPLRSSGNQKKYVLGLTDAFTKYVELVALPNKEAPTVAQAIFEKWFCRFGIPLEVITDQGKEFCAELTEDLFKLMKVEHRTTTAYHPQCNSQAEVANKTIAKYLASFVDDSTLDWEDYLAPLMFCYNTSFHRSTKATPFFLTYGMEARQPGLPGPDVRRKFYGESSTDELLLRLMAARNVARQNNELASDRAKDDFDKKAQPHAFSSGQLVLLDEHSFLHKNAKLAPKWTGPHRVVRLKNDNNVELKLKNGRSLITHVNRLKPYKVPLPTGVEFKETDCEKETATESAQKQTLQSVPQAKETPSQGIELQDDQFLPPFENAPVPVPSLHPAQVPPTRAPSVNAPPPTRARSHTSMPPSPARSLSHTKAPIVTPSDADFAASAFIAPPVKRGRGRPRKIIVTPDLPPVPETLPAQEGGGVQEGENTQVQGEGVGEDAVNINILNSEWTVVVKKRKQSHKKSDKVALKAHKHVYQKRGPNNDRWSQVWRSNFKQYGDTYKTVSADEPSPIVAQLPPGVDQGLLPALPGQPDHLQPEVDLPDLPPEPADPDHFYGEGYSSEESLDGESSDGEEAVVYSPGAPSTDPVEPETSPTAGPSRPRVRFAPSPVPLCKQSGNDSAGFESHTETEGSSTRAGPQTFVSRVPGVDDLTPDDVGELRRLLGSPEPRTLRSRGVVLSPEVLRKFPETRKKKKK